MDPIENRPRYLLFPRALVGSETDQELRAQVLQLVQNCSLLEASQNCPLRPLKGLSHVTLKDTLNRLPRETVLAILQEELACRAQRHCGNNPGLLRTHRGAA
jgi:hypothetical protein